MGLQGNQAASLFRNLRGTLTLNLNVCHVHKIHKKLRLPLRWLVFPITHQQLTIKVRLPTITLFEDVSFERANLLQLLQMVLDETKAMESNIQRLN